MSAGMMPVSDEVFQQEYGAEWKFHRDHMNPDGEMGRLLRAQLFAYCMPSDFAGHRVLDFGSGEGGSAFIMSSLLPQSEIVGVELNAEQVARANRLARSTTRTVTFYASPRGTDLPPNLGTFQFIMLSGVFEHLLPEERRDVLPKLWACLNVGGILFVNQTPHRWFPYEHHSTGLWGINYLPDRLAMLATRVARINREYNRKARDDWERHLRGGLRGGTEREVIKRLTRDTAGSARVLQPIHYKDRAEYWMLQTSPRYRVLKRGLVRLFRLSERLLGTIPTMNVDVAIRREF